MSNEITTGCFPLLQESLSAVAEVRVRSAGVEKWILQSLRFLRMTRMLCRKH